VTLTILIRSIADLLPPNHLFPLCPNAHLLLDDRNSSSIPRAPHPGRTFSFCCCCCCSPFYSLLYPFIRFCSPRLPFVASLKPNRTFGWLAAFFLIVFGQMLIEEWTNSDSDWLAGLRGWGLEARRRLICGFKGN